MLRTTIASQDLRGNRPAPSMDLGDFARWIVRHGTITVLTGAGCSTESGIPDYRDSTGAWKRAPPMSFQEFLSGEAARRRYWARSTIGWARINRAEPNDAHRVLAALEEGGIVGGLITQNVDGLHRRAGQRSLIELHGRLDQVICLSCSATTPRVDMQQRLLDANPGFATHADDVRTAPDGDADLEGDAIDAFSLPSCTHCGGVLKPDVVFFGEQVPTDRVEQARAWIGKHDALLIVGSSLMVQSGYRFARWAADAGKSLVSVNLGQGRADDLLHGQVSLPAVQALEGIQRELGLYR